MLLEFLQSIPDHRDRQARQYDLAHMLMFTILAILSNAKNYADVFEFIDVHFEKLKEVFKLTWKKCPDYTTVRNVLIGIDIQSFEAMFRAYAISRGARNHSGKHLCFDGKSLNGSFQNSKNKRAAQIFEVFSACIVLAHVSIDEKDHEIPAFQELLMSLPLKGSIVTVDALHCQKKHLHAQSKRESD